MEQKFEAYMALSIGRKGVYFQAARLCLPKMPTLGYVKLFHGIQENTSCHIRTEVVNNGVLIILQEARGVEEC